MLSIDARVELPRGVPLKDDPNQVLPFSEIHKIFASSPYGDSLRDNVRYDNKGKGFKPKFVSKAEWRNALGKDVCNREHGPYTFRLAKGILALNAIPAPCWEGDIPDPARLTPVEQTTVMLAGITHDWGEANPKAKGPVRFPKSIQAVGDVRFGNKTTQVEQDEEFIQTTLANHYLGMLVGEEWIDRVADILRDTTTPPGALFKMVERVGYLSTALRARREAKTGRHSKVMTRALNRLAIDVGANQLPEIVDTAQTYPGIKHLLERRSPLITEIVLETPGELAALTSLPEEKLTKARDTWANFIKPSTVSL